ncbi:MAG: PEGA domain-containing protein [Planctomycetota bacterium]|jgi:WD40 repeat protein
MSRVTKIGGATLLLLAALGVLAALAQTAEEVPTELYVRTMPSGATILVDGKPQGTSPRLFEVEPGDHTVVVKLAGHDPVTEKVTIPDGRIRRVVLRLQKRPDAGAGTVQSAAPVPKPRRVTLPHADRVREQGTPAVLDLASGELLAQPKTADDEAIAKYWDQLGRGDLAYPGEGLLILRRGTAEQWNLTVKRFTPAEAIYQEPGGTDKPLAIGYALDNVPLRLRITSGDGKRFDVTVLWMADDGGIVIEYRPSPESEGTEPGGPEGGADFGPIIERVICDDKVGKDWLMDLDTSLLVTPPRHLDPEQDRSADADELMAWMKGQGIDLSGIKASTGVVCGLDLQVAVMARPEGAARLRREDIYRALEDPAARIGGERQAGIVATWLEKLPDDVNYAFKTREGGIGAFAVLGTTEDGRGVKIRYALVREAASGTSLPLFKPKLSLRKLFSASHGPNAGVLAVAFSPDGKTVAAVDEQANVVLRDARTGGLTMSFDLLAPEERQSFLRGGHPRDFRSGAIALSPDGKTLAVGGGPLARLYDVASGRLRVTLEDTRFAEQHKQYKTLAPRAHGSVSSVAFSPDSALLATSGSPIVALTPGPGPLKIWDAKTGELKHDLREHDVHVTSVAFSPDGTSLASAEDHTPTWTSRRCVRFWDPETGKVKRVLSSPRGDPWRIAFSPDGRRLAAGGLVHHSEDDATGGVLLIWDAGTGALLLSRNLASWVTSVSFSPDGKTLATGEYEQGVTLWDAETLEPKVKIRPHTDMLREVTGAISVAFSPTGTLLAMGAESEVLGFVTVFEIGPREPVASP